VDCKFITVCTAYVVTSKSNKVEIKWHLHKWNVKKGGWVTPFLDRIPNGVVKFGYNKHSVIANKMFSSKEPFYDTKQPGYNENLVCPVKTEFDCLRIMNKRNGKR